jgi:hypothetical protein
VNQDTIGFGQARTSMRLKDVFDYAFITETLNGTQPTGPDMAKSVPLGPVEATKLPNGRVYHKVFFYLLIFHFSFAASLPYLIFRFYLETHLSTLLFIHSMTSA